jgi:glycosyltransferase involved in cell wall biosynthesis
MKISICAISLNEADHLQEWYNIHKDLADEIILVDTGSWDGTQEIAKRLPIKFFEIKWTHDFAEAKNMALRTATGDWVLFQSPDFWIHPDNFQKLRDLLENTREVVAYGLPNLSNDNYGAMDMPKEMKVERAEMFAKTHVCLFKNDFKIYYKNRVHENVHDSIKENYGEHFIELTDIPRYHHTPQNVYENKDKVRYFWFLEDYASIERKFWEHAEVLRKKCYDNEL